MSYAGYAAAKAQTERQSKGFYHDLALNAEKAMYEKAYETLQVFSGK